MHPPTSWNIFPHTTTSFYWNNITQAEDSLVPETAPEYLRPILLNQKKRAWHGFGTVIEDVSRSPVFSLTFSLPLSQITLWAHIAVFKVYFYLIRGLLLPIKYFKKTCCLDFGAGQGGAEQRCPGVFQNTLNSQTFGGQFIQITHGLLGYSC